MIYSCPARLVYLGGAVIDHIYQIDALPALGSEITAQSFTRMAGGGFNLMAAAARSGLPVVFAGCHGSGENGAWLRHMLEQEGITVLFQQHRQRDSGHCVVLVTPDAERSFITVPGAEAYLEKAALEALETGSRDWLVTSGYSFVYPGCGEILTDWIEHLNGDMVLVFDPSPVVGDISPHILHRVLQRTHWLSCNAREAQIITGETTPQGSIERIVTRLLQEYCVSAQGVVVRTGHQGCHLAMRGEEPVHIPAFKVAAVDSNGAGDSHLGAFIAALALGYDTKKSLLYANAAAAIAVTRPGGATAPNSQEIDAFLQKHLGVDWASNCAQSKTDKIECKKRHMTTKR